MTAQPPSYRRQFWKSPHHVVTALATLGAGLILGADYPLALVLAPAAYALGWIYLPDFRFFRNWADRRRDAAQLSASQAEVADFMQQRDALLDKLSSPSQRKYHTLAAVCKDIEVASAENSMTPDNPADDPRLRKLDELMWSYLRMLTIQESLEKFLETERRDDVPRLLQDAETEVRSLTAEFEALKKKAANVTALDSKERLFNSRLEKVLVVWQKVEKIPQTEKELPPRGCQQER